jgi:hypothetical protein
VSRGAFFLFAEDLDALLMMLHGHERIHGSPIRSEQGKPPLRRSGPAIGSQASPQGTRLPKAGREPTSGLFGKGQPLTKLKPSKAQRRPIPGST